MRKKSIITMLFSGCTIVLFGCSDNASVLTSTDQSVTTACTRDNEPNQCVRMQRIINADPFGKITLQGYDPVAFHTQGAAVRGLPSITAEYHGYKYLFASEENKALFEANAEQYLPAYGGFCAFGVSLGVLFPVEISTWVIINGRLILQFSDEFKQIFNQNTEENIAKADSVWTELNKKKPHQHQGGH